MTAWEKPVAPMQVLLAEPLLLLELAREVDDPGEDKRKALPVLGARVAAVYLEGAGGSFAGKTGTGTDRGEGFVGDNGLERGGARREARHAVAVGRGLGGPALERRLVEGVGDLRDRVGITGRG